DASGHRIGGAFERDLHALFAGESVDQHGHLRALGLLEQKRRTAVLDAAVGELGDFELGVHFKRDALQFTVLFQGANELAQIGIGHSASLVLMTNRTAFVTGASRGIGLACAKALAAAGARVILAARDTAKLEAASAEIPGSSWVQIDMSS